MRALVIVVVFAAVAAGGTYLGLFLYRQRRQGNNTPALDAVAKMLDAPFRDVDNVTGTLDGRAVTYLNFSDRYSNYTQLTISAPNSQVLLEIKRKNLGDPLELVQGAPTIDANTIMRELGAEMTKLAPRSIIVDDKQLQIRTEHILRDDAEATALVRLGADLAKRVKASVAPDDKAIAQRAQMRADQGARREKQILAAVVVFAILGAATVLGVRAMLARRSGQAQSSSR